MSNESIIINNDATAAEICSRELKKAFQVSNDTSLNESEIVHSIKENCIDTRRELSTLETEESTQERSRNIVGMICDIIVALFILSHYTKIVFDDVIYPPCFYTNEVTL